MTKHTKRGTVIRYQVFLFNIDNVKQINLQHWGEPKIYGNFGLEGSWR